MKLTEQQKQIVISTLEPYQPKFVGIFGSYAREEESVNSDLAEDLEQNLGVRVDLQTPRSVSSKIKPYILSDLQVIYGSKP